MIPTRGAAGGGVNILPLSGNAITGMGDALLMGQGDRLRGWVDKATGWNLRSAVDPCSTAYRAGYVATEAASLAVGSGRLGYAAAAKGLSAVADTADAAVQGRNALKIAFRLGLDRTSRIYTTEQMMDKYKTAEAVIRR